MDEREPSGRGFSVPCQGVWSLFSPKAATEVQKMDRAMEHLVQAPVPLSHTGSCLSISSSLHPSWSSQDPTWSLFPAQRYRLGVLSSPTSTVPTECDDARAWVPGSAHQPPAPQLAKAPAGWGGVLTAWPHCCHQAGARRMSQARGTTSLVPALPHARCLVCVVEGRQFSPDSNEH